MQPHPHPRPGLRSARVCAAGLCAALAAAAASAALALGAPTEPPGCDPTRATCVTPCGPLDAARGKCTPGEGGGRGGTDGGGTGGGGGGNSSGDGGGGSCAPAPGGRPGCGDAGPASLGGGGTGGGVPIGAGNPINLLTGNKYQEEVDLPPLPGVLGLELKRHYNSQVPHAGLAGAHWRISYETVLYDLGTQIQIVQADGRRLTFQRGRGASAALCGGARWEDGQVRIEAASARPPVYHWRWPDGRTLTFAGGSGGGHPLQSIAVASGQRLTLAYGPDGALLAVRDPQGRQLRFLYTAAGALHAVDTPIGRVVYAHDGLGRLREASRAGVARVYHYEDAHNGGHANALTGISVRSARADGGPVGDERIATYHYNAAGQAILSVRGRPLEWKNGQPVPDTGIEQVTLDFVTRALPFEGHADRATGEVVPRQVGRTVVTNSLGHTTEVLHAVIGGHHRVLEMRGAGCAGCGPVPMRYAWDALGHLQRATHLDADGRPRSSERFTYDAHGRVTRVVAQREPSPHGPAASDRTTRYHYADRRFADGSIALAPWPSRIEQPSVVAGRTLELHITYDALARPVTWTELGYSPIDERGRPHDGGQPIQRTTTFRYADVDGTSVLTEIDGPLPNGPAADPTDSDITRLHWDPHGRFLTGATLPLGRHLAFEHDEATGRGVAVTGPGRATTRWRTGGDGQIEHIEHMVGALTLDAWSFGHDALGRLREVERDDGGAAIPVLRQSFDLAGRLRWRAERLGILRIARYDTESRLLASRVQSSTMRQEERYHRDALGRLDRIDDDTGAVRRLVHDAAGRLVEAVDPLGRGTRFSYDDEGGIRIVQGAGSAQELVLQREADVGGHAMLVAATGARRLAFRRWMDDFGREVMTEDPDGGRVLRRHDQAGRVTHLQDAAGSSIDIVYDPAGRVVSRSVTPNAALGAQAGGIPHRDAEPQTTRYRYAGERLVGIQHASYEESLEHDEAGRLVARTLRLTSMSGGPIEAVFRHRYDPLGRLVATSLPDGSELRYERNGQGQVVALHRRVADFLPFGWGDTRLAGDLQRDLTGLSRLSYGNGVTGRWIRSPEGVLARVAYTLPAIAPSPSWRTAVDSILGEASAATRVSSPTPTAPTAPTAATAPALAPRAASAPASSNTPAPAPASLSPDAAAALPGAYGVPADASALWDERLLFDTAGNVVAQRQVASRAGAQPHDTLYAYDAHDQLAQAIRAHAAPSSVAVAAGAHDRAIVWRYHHDGLGNRLLAQEAQPASSIAHTTAAAYADRHSNRQAGVPQARWSADGRLIAVRLPDGRTARYRYDHRGWRIGKQVGDTNEHYLHDEHGHRLADLDAQGRIRREYVWLADQPIAVIDLDRPRVPEAAPATLAERIGRTIAAAWRLVAGRGERIAYLHVDHLGAPVLMTDSNARPVWSAEYAPFGQRLATPTRLDHAKLQLRLPGQWEDEESGLHYNEQRYYDPSRGRYLSRDPLGLRGGLNPYAYAGNNPIAFTDPHGLLLFAFDGTGNDESDPDRLSNVVRFRDLYKDRKFYVTGPGTRDPRTGIDNPLSKGGELADIAASLTGKERIARLLADLNRTSDDIDDAIAIDIDVIGFSRGAAEARDFANQIVKASRNGYYGYSTKDGIAHCQKLDLRFMGLWDTVLSFHTGDYNLGIPAEFDHVTQAVALNEYRGVFGLESIRRGTAAPEDPTRIERGFLGSHSDIGGSFADGELARVALRWVVDQAQAAGVSMESSPLLESVIANPVLHDKSGTLLKQDGPAPTSVSADRAIRFLDGTAMRERRAAIPGMSFPDTGQFIHYATDPHGTVAGTVDMERYLAWLNLNGYGIDMKIEGVGR